MPKKIIYDIIIESKPKKTAEDLAKLKEAALPLIKYLNENHDPHVTVIVTNTSVELMEGRLKIPKIYDFVKG